MRRSGWVTRNPEIAPFHWVAEHQPTNPRTLPPVTSRALSLTPGEDPSVLGPRCVKILEILEGREGSMEIPARVQNLVNPSLCLFREKPSFFILSPHLSLILHLSHVCPGNSQLW